MTRVLQTLMVAALFVGMAAPASSQATFGVKLGANFATLAGDDVVDAESRTGLVAGGLLHYRLSDLLAIQPELLFSQKGASFSEVFFDEQVTGTIMLDYIELPVLLRVGVPAGSPELRPTLHVGPAFAYEVRCRIKVEAAGESETEDCDDPEFESDRRSVDVGLALGAGLDIAFGTGTLVIEGRYTMGLRTLDGSADPEDVKNRAVSVLFSYRFGR